MDMAKIQKYLEKVDLFKGLTPEDMVKIFSKGLTMNCAKGEVIFYKGTEGNQMYVVLGGKVGVFEGQQCIATILPGDSFGEMALVNKEPRSATVIALEDCRLFVLNETTFEHLMTKRVAIRMLFNIIGTLSRRLKESNLRLAH